MMIWLKETPQIPALQSQHEACLLLFQGFCVCGPWQEHACVKMSRVPVWESCGNRRQQPEADLLQGEEEPVHTEE